MKSDYNYIEINKKLWNERVHVHSESKFYDVNGFLAGNIALNQIELNLLGDIKGKKVLIIDDVITAGTAIREAMTMLNAGGGTACGVIIALDRQEKVSDTSTKSAIQTVQTEYSIPVLNVVRLDDLLSFAKSSDEMSSFLPSIEAYRLKYGVEY